MESSKHQHQATATNPLEEALCSPSDLQAHHHHHHHHHQQLLQQQDRKPAPPAPEQALSCPRCNSTNTKFCYYNNYSLSQPRYFCKGCRRYWTKGGTLRNVPVGGGCRKNKRSSSSKKSQDQNYNIIPTCSFGALLPSLSPPPPPLVFDPHALTLAFSALHKAPVLADGAHIGDLALGSSTGGAASPLRAPQLAPGTFLDVLRTGFLDSSAGAFDDDLYYYGFSGGHHGNGEDVEEGDVAEERASTAPFFFEGGLGGSTPITQLAAQEASCKGTADGDHNWLFMGLQRQVNGGDGRGGIAVDPGRDYNWNGTSSTGSSNWHGLVNIAP